MIRRPLGNGRRQPPILNLPPTTRLVAAVLLLGFLASLVPDLRFVAFYYLAFDPFAGPVRWVTGAATYGLLHAGFMHLLGNLLGIVILGPLVERRLGSAALILVLLLGAFAGALAHTLVQIATGGDAALIGASASAAALIGWSLRQIREHRGFGHLDQAVNLYGALFILFNLVGIVLFHDSPIAYAAHAGGFLAGWLYGGGRRRIPDRAGRRG
ncbi:rhomboid family intramembrane serine protease [Benzoatithermus flavus]|uniref:Rhomboid family intramembrane serine protease n=1 Tax=Benzoatithermus flavus TaxID=3108223 RepID=A0ABU8XUP5_9PROT